MIMTLSQYFDIKIPNKHQTSVYTPISADIDWNEELVLVVE